MNASFAFHVDPTQPGRTHQGFAPPRPVGRALDGTCPAASAFPERKAKEAERRISRKTYIARGTYSGGRSGRRRKLRKSLLMWFTHGEPIRSQLRHYCGRLSGIVDRMPSQPVSIPNCPNESKRLPYRPPQHADIRPDPALGWAPPGIRLLSRDQHRHGVAAPVADGAGIHGFLYSRRNFTTLSQPS